MTLLSLLFRKKKKSHWAVKVCSKLNSTVWVLTADKAIAVEDSPTGIASAKAAGLKVLALKPRHGEPLDQSAADCIITQLMDVKEHLD